MHHTPAVTQHTNNIFDIISECFFTGVLFACVYVSVLFLSCNIYNFLWSTWQQWTIGDK